MEPASRVHGGLSRWKQWVVIGAVLAIVALPFALRPKRALATQAEDTVVIVTPHNEAIRSEYARGFEAWYRVRTGRTVSIDWRVLGGTSEIARFLESEYVAAFQNRWVRKLGKAWSAEVQAGFQSDRSDASPAAKEARAEFLASEVGCGIDVFFGGGTYDFDRQARAGRLVDSGVRVRHPEWLADDTIPARRAGEEYRDREGRWIGSVLSVYGIVFNRDAWARLGFEREPRQWEDLADPRAFGEVALADPTKSGSVAKAFENIIQKQMQRELAAARKAPGAAADVAAIERSAVRRGWLAGLKLIQLMGANARYFTDSSQKPPIDVAAGNCAAGLCIDYFGRQQQEAVQRRTRGDDETTSGAPSTDAANRGESGVARLGYISPAGGSVASVDPIGLLRGAHNREVAQAFIDYVLSMDGQKLWNFRPGTPGGPERFALRRLPVRKDFYAHEEWRRWRSDPDESPYDDADPLIYRPEWTGEIFREMAFVVRVMCQDTHAELAEAWRTIIAAPEPRKKAALAVLQDLSAVDYDRAFGEIHRALTSKNKVDEVKMARSLGNVFRENYTRALAIASGR
jgi:ABC-type Fe3+ transport system substrate-binding protein